MPSNPYDARGLLLQSIRDDDHPTCGASTQISVRDAATTQSAAVPGIGVVSSSSREPVNVSTLTSDPLSISVQRSNVPLYCASTASPATSRMNVARKRPFSASTSLTISVAIHGFAAAVCMCMRISTAGSTTKHRIRS